MVSHNIIIQTFAEWTDKAQARYEQALGVTPEQYDAIAKGRIEQIVILERGTTDGAVTLGIVFVDVETGKKTICETTAKLFHATDSVLTGAESRFRFNQIKKQ